jgi:hypothetical protein
VVNWPFLSHHDPGCSVESRSRDARPYIHSEYMATWRAILGEGGPVSFDPSADLMHGQKTLYGSWVSSVWRMEELLDKLVCWNQHPDLLVTNRFPLEEVSDAYALMASGKSGKIAVCADEELC